MPANRCSVSECERPYHAKGYCRPHYRRSRKKTSLKTPFKGETVIRDAEGRKYCRACGLWLDPARFAKVQAGSDGLDSRCHRCRTLGRHGMTKQKFAALVEAQSGTCANPGCGATEPGGRGEWHIDHDHSCCSKKFSCGRCIRGLLCYNCNVGLGLLGDSRERLEGLLAYMGNPPARNLTMYAAPNQGEHSE